MTHIKIMHARELAEIEKVVAKSFMSACDVDRMRLGTVESRIFTGRDALLKQMYILFYTWVAGIWMQKFNEFIIKQPHLDALINQTAACHKKINSRTLSFPGISDRGSSMKLKPFYFFLSPHFFFHQHQNTIPPAPRLQE